MILKINFVDSKIMTIVANFFVKIEQVIFFPNTVIYKKIKLIPPEEETLSIVNKCTCYTSQKERHLGILANREEAPLVLLIVLSNNK